MIQQFRLYLEQTGALQDKSISTCLRMLETDDLPSLLDFQSEALIDAGMASQVVERFSTLVQDFLGRNDEASQGNSEAYASYAGRNAGQARRLLVKLLAQHHDSLTLASENWPAPLAHEFHRLLEELEQGSPVTVLWQLIDCYEVTMKFITLVIASDVLRSLPADKTRELRKQLFSTLSGGAWGNLRHDLVKIARENTTTLLIPELLADSRFWIKGGNGSFASAFNSMIQYRNSTKGHGALGYDQLEQVEGLTAHLDALARSVAAHPHAWAGLRLTDTEHGAAWCGWQTFRARHDGDPGEHIEGRPGFMKNSPKTAYSSELKSEF